MDLALSVADRELQQKARDFTDQVLVPLEDECEEHDGLTPESAAAAKQAVLDWDFHAINHAEADGGRGYDLFQQMLIEEQGRATGALWDIPWRPSIPLAAGSEEQKDRFLRPACRGSAATRTRSRRRPPAPTRRWSRRSRPATATRG